MVFKNTLCENFQHGKEAQAADADLCALPLLDEVLDGLYFLEGRATLLRMRHLGEEDGYQQRDEREPHVELESSPVLQREALPI